MFSDILFCCVQWGKYHGRNDVTLLLDLRHNDHRSSLGIVSSVHSRMVRIESWSFFRMSNITGQVKDCVPCDNSYVLTTKHSMHSGYIRIGDTTYTNSEEMETASSHLWSGV